MSPSLSFFGAAGTVTGSRYLLDDRGRRANEILKSLGGFKTPPRVTFIPAGVGNALAYVRANADAITIGETAERSRCHDR